MTCRNSYPVNCNFCWSSTAHMWFVHICSLSNKKFDHIKMTFVSRVVKWRGSVVPRVVDICSIPCKKFDDFKMSLRRCDSYWGRTGRIFFVHVYSLFNKKLHSFKVSMYRTLDNFKLISGGCGWYMTAPRSARNLIIL